MSSRIITVSLLFALASVGVAYAAWSSTLNVGVTAEGGNMTIQWKPGAAWADCDEIPGPEAYATTTASRHPSDTQLMQVHIEDAYPGYQVKCDFVSQNLSTSTMPAQLTGLYVESTQLADSGDCVDIDVVGSADPDLNVCLLDGDGLLGIGASKTKSIVITVLDGLPMNSTLAFTAHVNFKQMVP
jgi:hypothetical protein